MIKIMVTGAGGFIGGRVSRFLGVRSSQVAIFDITRNEGEVSGDGGAWADADAEVAVPETGTHAAPDGSTRHSVSLDLSDHDSVRSVIADIRPDIVIHTAGVTPHRTGVVDADYRVQNVDNSVALLNALTDAKKAAGGDYDPAFIFASTVGVYGAPHRADGRVREDDTPSPQSVYTQSKVDFETILQGQGDIRYAILRYSNIPGRDAFINHVVTRGEVTFFGVEPYVRDYIHLDDLCDLHARAVDYLLKGGASVTLNAGSGVGFSFPDLVDEIERQTGRTITRHQAEARENDVIRLICDVQKAADVLHWTPKHTTIKDIVAYALENYELGTKKDRRPDRGGGRTYRV